MSRGQTGRQCREANMLQTGVGTEVVVVLAMEDTSVVVGVVAEDEVEATIGPTTVVARKRERLERLRKVVNPTAAAHTGAEVVASVEVSEVATGVATVVGLLGPTSREMDR